MPSEGSAWIEGGARLREERVELPNPRKTVDAIFKAILAATRGQ
jgi:hypothetical protein